jgi:hypothetical protein
LWLNKERKGIEEKEENEEGRTGLVLQHPWPAWIWPAIETHGWVSPAVVLLKPGAEDARF